MGSEMSDMSMSDDYEKYFMPFILVLVLCLLLSVYFYNPAAFGFKCRNGKCVKVNEAPNGNAGDEGTVYSNAIACAEYCDTKSYGCVVNGNERECIPSSNGVDPANGFFANRQLCQANCRN